jgi:hypothetical protein
MGIAMGIAKPDGEAKSFNLFDSKEENLKTNDSKPTVEQTENKTVQEPQKTETVDLAKNERERIIDILNLSGVELSNELTKAIADGQTKEAYCVALVEANKGVLASNASEIGAIAPAPEAKDTVIVTDKKQSIEKQAQAIYEAMKGRK